MFEGFVEEASHLAKELLLVYILLTLREDESFTEEEVGVEESVS